MKPQEFYNDFVAYCEQHADPQMVKKYARYFKENYDAYGLTQPLMDEKVKEILANKGFNLELLEKAAPLFFKNGKYETTSLLLSLLNRMHKQYTPHLFDVVDSWFAMGISNWAHAEILGKFILLSL